MKFSATAVVAALAVAGTVQANTVTKPTGPQTPINAPTYEGGSVPPSTEYALEQLNKVRASKGLQPLCINKALQASAQAHSDWMARTGQHKHAADTFQRMERYGYPGNVLRAENIAVNQNGVADYNCFGYGPKVSDVNSSAAYTTNCAWYNSAGHKENMLNPNFNQVGIAYSKGTWAGRESYFWTQNFGRSSQPCVGKGDYKPAPPAKKPVAPVPETPAYKEESPKVAPAKPTKVVEIEYEVKPVTPVKKCKKWIKDGKKKPVPTDVYGGDDGKDVKKPTPTDVYGGDEEQKAPAKPTTPAGGDYSYGEAPVTPGKVKPVPTDVYGGDDETQKVKPLPTDVYGEEPVYGKKPVQTKEPVTPGYGEDQTKPVPTTPAGGDYSYGEETPIQKDTKKPVPTDVYGEEPVYGKKPVQTKEPVTPGYGEDQTKPVPTTPAGGDYSYGEETPIQKDTKKPTPTDVYGGEGETDKVKPVPTDVYGEEPVYGKKPVQTKEPVTPGYGEDQTKPAKPQPTESYGEGDKTPVTKKPKKCKPKKVVVKPVPTDTYGESEGDKAPATPKPTTPAADYSYGAPAPAPAPVTTEPAYGKKPTTPKQETKKEEKKTVEEPKQETVYNGDSFY